MHYSLFTEFVGKNVAVYVSGDRFAGILKMDPQHTTLFIAPVDIHDQKRYGTAVIDGTKVSAIREIKPRPVSVDNGDEADDCERSS
jgi:hypothetical protein